jgi:hypothetical protein
MMSDMVPSRIPRLVRGAVAAAFATLVALFAHVIAGGQTPAAVGVVVPLLLSVAACTLLAGRRLSIVRLSASVGIAQFLFHMLFVLGTGSTTAPSAPVSHHIDPAVTASILDAEATVHSHGVGVGMWVGHLLAAFVTIGVLYFAERLLLTLAAIATRVNAWVRRLVESLTRPVPPVFPLRDTVVASGSRVLHAGVRLGSATRRGPPFLSV